MSDLGRFWRAARRVSRTHYPRFIFGLPLHRDSIPVFTYHDVDHDTFALDLDFLRANGYRTLSLDEYLHVKSGKRVAAPRSVLLTFDDARKSFFTVALPLLRDFNAHAVLFAPSYWMSERAEGVGLFMNWAELRACAESGHVDVESHAHRHALVAVDPTVVDFANPQALTHYDIYDWPMRQTSTGEELGRPALGTPVYRATPLLSATRRYVENAALTRLCCDFVTRAGGAAFFAEPDWQSALNAEHRKHAREMQGEWASDAALRALVASEFEQCRAEFKQHLGFTPKTIAYPWMLGSPLSLELAHAAGFVAAFGVALDFGAERRANAQLPVFGRFKCDWLRFLPGQARSSVLSAVRHKIGGFLAAQHLAH